MRALRFYLSRTCSLGGKETLFLPLREMASRMLSPNTISAWLKKAISLAYEVAGKDEELGCLHLLWAHDTRAFTASWDALQSVSVGNIIATCRWRIHNTFTSFYLRDFVEMEAWLLACTKVLPDSCFQSGLGCVHPALPVSREQERGSPGVHDGFIVQWLASAELIGYEESASHLLSDCIDLSA